MDLSKLPKLSQTPRPADQVEPSAGSASQSQPPPVELYCRCGAAITPGTKFCSNCGASYQEAVGGGAVGSRDRARDHEPALGGAMWIEAFISIAVGLFLIMIAPTGIKYLSATLSGKPFTPYLHPTEANTFVDFLRYQDPSTGAITDYHYRDMFDKYWSDMSVTAFALALILEGVVLAVVRNRWMVLVSALIIAGVTILNLWYVIASMTRVSPITRQAYGFPPLSAIAVIFGVVMTGYQFMMFRELNARTRR
jgi:hypothetical protein